MHGSYGRGLAVSASISLAALTVATSAHAAPLLTGLGGPVGFGPNALATNDDGSTAAIDLSPLFPQGMILYGTQSSSAFVNNNGNVSLVGPIFSYTPMNLPVASRPMFAPLWGDVDTRAGGAAGSNVVYWSLTASSFVVTWFDVGYYMAHVDHLNGFQMIVTPAGGAGDYDVEFRYSRCEWTSGDASGGTGGLGGTPADAGIDGGNSVDALRMPTASTLDLCTQSNAGSPGLWELRVRGGIASLCGNGIAEGAEGCDGPDTPPGDTCFADCTIVTAADGAPCTVGEDCASTFCADGVCCNVACDGAQCEACAEAGGAIADGVCTNLTGAACDDGDLCTAVDTCQSGLCVGAGRPSCDPIDDCHAAGTCDPSTGSCSDAPAAADGTVCSGGTCQGGVCEPSEGTGGSGGGPSTGGGSAGMGGQPEGSGGSAEDQGGGGADGGDSGGGCDCSLSVPASPRRVGGLGVVALVSLAAWQRARRRRTAQRRP